jgi:excisionase family DNA binding protein
MKPKTPPLVGSTEACERIGIGRSTLTMWIQAGRIAYVQKLPGPKGVYLFDPTEVERVRRDYQAEKAS